MFGEPRVEHALVPQRGRRLTQGLQVDVQLVLEVLEVREGVDAESLEVVGHVVVGAPEAGHGAA